MYLKMIKVAKSQKADYFLSLAVEHQGGPNLFLSSQTDKLMAGTKFSDYLGLNHYKKAKNKKNSFI